MHARPRLGLVAAALLAPLLAVVGGGAPAAVADDAAPVVTTLPAPPDGLAFQQVALDGDVVYARLAAPSVPAAGTGTLYRTSADGTGSWETVPHPDTGQPIPTGTLVVQHDVVVVRQAPGTADSCTQYLLMRPDSHRTFESCVTPTLFPGGRLVSRALVGSSLLSPVEGGEERAGSPGLVVEGTRSYAVDGRTLRGVDLLGASPDLTRPLPAACAEATVYSARDDLVSVDCAFHSALVDVRGSAPVRAPRGGVRGLGFSVQADPADASRLIVSDLGVAQARWTVPLTGRLQPDVADRSDLLVSTATAAQVVSVPVSARVTSALDHTAPTVAFVQRPAAFVRSGDRSLDWAWSGQDDEAGTALAYDVEASRGPFGAPVQYGPDRFDTDLARTTRHDATDAADRDVRACVRVRARDWAGNTSPWTSTCTYVDGYGPRTSWRGISTWWTQSPFRPVVMGYAATDVSGVGSYDVARRVAAPGRPWTASVVPAAWKGTAARSVSQRFAPGTNVCFTVRARDRVGNVSSVHGNAREACTAVPYDDRSFARSAGARATSGPGVGGTLTELRGSASIVRRVTARELRVRVYGSGCVTATFGGHVYNRDGCLGGGGGGGAHWITVRFPSARTGTVKIQSLWGDPIRVDAVAALR